MFSIVKGFLGQCDKWKERKEEAKLGQNLQLGHSLEERRYCDSGERLEIIYFA